MATKPMKIIIVGGGLCGLSTYLSLQKYLSPIIPLDITIYESHDPSKLVEPQDANFGELSSYTATVGGGLGIAYNGIRLLRDINQELYDTVKNTGFNVRTFVFQSARGWRLFSVPNNDPQGKSVFPDGDSDVCVSISRHDLWKTLYHAVGGEEFVIKPVVSASKGSSSSRPQVTFTDGSTDDADLVIGADGVRSSVMRSLLADEGIEPKYEGLIGVGGFIDDSVPAEVDEEKSMVFTFGRNGFFGYGASSPHTTMWWSTWSEDELPKDRKLSQEEMSARLKSRHGAWKDPNIQDIIEKAHVSQMYPVWTTPDLPYWGANGILGVGDAVHALQPTSGQGCSQGK
jgi:2-polyprenyl-6-methoxyphenol hydroxylase-like FAD-dependent oxidoreductase